MAKIYLTDVIGGWGGIQAEDIVRQLHSIDDDTIELYVNSPGGEVFESVAILNALRDHPARIVTRVLGLAASGAATISVGASDSLTMGGQSRMMIHRAHQLTFGTARDLRSVAEILDTIDDDQIDILNTRMNIGIKEVRQLLNAETWFTAAEAVAAGLADAVGEEKETVSEPETRASMQKFGKVLSTFCNVPADLHTVENDMVRAALGARAALKGIYEG